MEGGAYGTKRLLLRILGPEHALAVLDFYVRNRDFLAPTDPLRPKEFYTAEMQAAALAVEREERLEGRSLPLWICLREDPERVVGKISLSQICRGAFHNAYLGYKLDGALQGRGYATEAVGRAIRIAFGELGLHRIEAHVMPRNVRSIRLLERLGFEPEGYGARYLKIHGTWEDHVHFALVKGRTTKSAADGGDGDEAETARATRVRARGLLLDGDSTILRLATEADLAEVLAYRARNRERLDRWNPTLPGGGDLEATFRRRVLQSIHRFESGREADFLICLPDRPKKVIGSLTFRDIVGMPLASCEAGYSIDAACEGRGYMRDALHTGLRFMFEVFGLHRVNASCMLANTRSERLLLSLGFRREGVARRMLHVAGEWQDMALLSLLREDFLGEE